MDKVIIYCDGGLSNRLGSLIGGMELAKKNKSSYSIYWPKTDWCQAGLSDLFISLDSISESFQDAALIYGAESLLVISHYGGLIAGARHISIQESETFDVSPYRIIVYNNSLIPDFVSNSVAVSLLQEILIQPYIVDKVLDFITQNQISKDVIGVHLRETDMSIKMDINAIQNYITSNKDKKFFVCSDSLETENRFKELSNVCIYNKSAYAAKRDDTNSSWADNIVRGKQSVIEGFIDMLILSRTTLGFYNKISTFSYFSTLFSHCKL
jgi:hypothetical protein